MHGSPPDDVATGRRKRSMIGRVAATVGQGLAVVAAVGVVAVMVMPRLFGWQVVDVLSGSMTPTYPIRSVLAVESVDPADVRAGDVIAFRRQGDANVLVTHRVVSVERRDGELTFVTKGDANDTPDREPVRAANVRGRVVFGVPHLGRIVQVIRSPIGFALLLLVPAAAVIVHEAVSIDRTLRERRRGGPTHAVREGRHYRSAP